MKKALIIVGVIVVVLALVGTGVVMYNNNNNENKEKTPITADTFSTIMKEKGYAVNETTGLFAQYGNYISKSYAAQKAGYQIEFYELSSEENAIEMYNTNKEKFDAQKTNDSNPTIVSEDNYTTYSLNANRKYKYLSKINNTLIYIDVDDAYENTVKELIKEIGY